MLLFGQLTRIKVVPMEMTQSVNEWSECTSLNPVQSNLMVLIQFIHHPELYEAPQMFGASKITGTS